MQTYIRHLSGLAMVHADMEAAHIVPIGISGRREAASGVIDLVA